MEESWFSTWFNSEYYHLLYSNRDEDEAKLFVTELIAYLKLKEGMNVLDLACGKGRHARLLHQHGLRVVGLDLAEQSISTAKSFEKEGLEFVVGDMRNFELDQKFDAIFNFFTSFGYFENEEDNLAVLQSVKRHLKSNGFLLIDFLNAFKVQKSLVGEESLESNGVHFSISRRIESGFIIKEIEVNDGSRQRVYTEKVQKLELSEFIRFFEKTGLELIETFGDYNLSKYVPDESDRLILIAKPVKS